MNNVITLRPPAHACDWLPAWPLVSRDRLVELGLRRTDDLTLDMGGWVRRRDGAKGFIYCCPGCGRLRGKVDVTPEWAGLPLVMPKEVEPGERLATALLGFVAISGHEVRLAAIIEIPLMDLSGALRALQQTAQDQRVSPDGRAWRFGAAEGVVTASRVSRAGLEVSALRRTTSRSRSWACAACKVVIEAGVEHWTPVPGSLTVYGCTGSLGRHEHTRFCAACVNEGS